VDKPLESVTHGQCDARPTVTFPASGHLQKGKLLTGKPTIKSYSTTKSEHWRNTGLSAFQIAKKYAKK